MAASFIPVDNTKMLGHVLLQASSDARRFAEEIAALQSIMAGMVNASDYTILEAQFGLPAGQGTVVNYLIGQLATGLAGVSQFKLIADWFAQP